MLPRWKRKPRPKIQKIAVRIREVVGNGEVERIQVLGHVAPDDGVGSKITGNVVGDLGALRPALSQGRRG